MQTRHLLFAAAVGVAGIAVYALTRDGSEARPRAREGATTVARADRTSGLPPMRRVSPSTSAPRRPEPPRKFTDPRYPGVTFMEVKDAEQDVVQEAEDRLTYKKQRLRFALSDAAATCYSGPDDKADIELSYTLVVENQVLRVENLKMIDSTLPDLALEQCILDAIREVRSPATEIPDLREDMTSFIALHDLYVRNRPND